VVEVVEVEGDLTAVEGAVVVEEEELQAVVGAEEAEVDLTAVEGAVAEEEAGLQEEGEAEVGVLQVVAEVEEGVLQVVGEAEEGVLQGAVVEEEEEDLTAVEGVVEAVVQLPATRKCRQQARHRYSIFGIKFQTCSSCTCSKTLQVH
jgi:hypothetical protein